MLGVCALILFGGSHNAMALGFALILPGLALCIRPPSHGLGRWMDWGVLGFLLCMPCAFLPVFDWPLPEWRTEAEQNFGLELPWMRTVLPWISFEAWLMAVAGFAWLYAVSGWKLNVNGRKYFFALMSVLVGVMAGFVIWGNLYNLSYPGAEDAGVFSYFPNRNQTANFLALAGVVSFAFTIEGLRSRKLIHLVGLVGSALCLFALILSACRSGVMLYFGGVGLWFLCRLRAKSVPAFFKIGFPLLLLAFSLVITSKNESVERVVDFLSAPTQWEQEYRTLIYKDAISMVEDAPLLGNGVATFPAIFPQYRDESRSFQVANHPESDLFWVLAEVGLIGTACLGVFLFGYFKRCRGLTRGRGGLYRFIAYVAVLMFLIHCLVDVPGHRPGTVYFAILFAAFTMQHHKSGSATFRPLIWRTVGGVLSIVGCIWMVAGLTHAPFHSSTAIAHHQKNVTKHVDAVEYEQALASIDKLLEWNPLSWRAYFQRAQVNLSYSTDRSMVAADFRSARFLEPTLGDFVVEEGFAWLPYDLGRAVSAWRKTLFREMQFKDKAYLSMLRAGEQDSQLLAALIQLSKIDPHYRTISFGYMRAPAFMPEIEDELSIDASLGHFTAEQRAEILKAWIQYGDLDSVQAFVQAHRAELKDSWWLMSLILKERADFKGAVDFVRDHAPVPKIPKVEVDEAIVARMSREFAIMPQDVVKGTALLGAFMNSGDLKRALEVSDKMLEGHKPPSYVHYWRAEALYQMGDLIDSWYGFREYMRMIRDDVN